MQTENDNNLIINPNENDQFVDDIRMNEFAQIDEENSVETPENDDDDILDEEKPKKSPTGILIAIIVVLIIGGGAFYAYTFHRDFVAQYIPFLQSESDKQTETTTQIEESSEEAEEQTNLDENEIDYTASTETSEEEATLSDDIVADAITESLMQDAAKQVTNKTTAQPTIANNETQTEFRKALARPTWIISVSSVTKENIAKTRVKELRAAGNTADYYWIPDYVTDGNRYFKVFVGPFSTKTEAKNYLSSHELASDAYVLKVD